MSDLSWAKNWRNFGGPLYLEKHLNGTDKECFLIRVSATDFRFYCRSTHGAAGSQQGVLTLAEKLDVTSEEEAEAVGLVMARML